MSSFICPKIANSLFSYNEDSGELSLKKDRGLHGRIKKGTKVGSLHECGAKSSKKYYLRTLVVDKYIYVHRIIWVIMTGSQPSHIDHIDGNGLNNKWTNIRSVDQSVNGKNQKIHSSNTSGTGGITYRKDSNKWRARIMVDGKQIDLGTFKEKDEAISARLKAEIEFGFTI